MVVTWCMSVCVSCGAVQKLGHLGHFLLDLLIPLILLIPFGRVDCAHPSQPELSTAPC